MKRLLIAALVLSAFCAQADDLLAFPEAAGWGRWAKGARASSSPTVYHVTNLNDSGTGSLRDAVTSPNRIVVFDVSGVIKISSRIVFKSGIYVAGQTAPGEGITVYGDGCSFSGASNIICRYLRWRMGKNGSSGKDCAGIANGTNMIFDHCSFSWGQDETFSINPDGKGDLGNITLQNCIFGQGLLTHSAGGLMQANDITLYRNLYIDNKTRNNKVKGIVDYANNIVYNWGGGGCYIMGGDSSGSSYCTIEGNLFMNGPSASSDALSGGNSDFHYYGNDNWQDRNRNGKFDPSCIDDTQTGGGDKIATRYSDHPVLELWSGKELLEKSLPMVGASLPYRDRSDCYMVDEVMSYGKSGALISDETVLPIGAPNTWDWWSGTTRTDTDKDGMPDAWESANGTNPNVDDATTKASNGYLNIENYINSITAADRQFYLRPPVLPTKAASSTTTITVSWRDYTYGETGFQINYRVAGSSSWGAVTTSSNVTSVVISGLAKATTYEINVQAFGPDSSGTIQYSENSPTITAATRASGETIDIDTYEPDVTWQSGLTTWNKTTTGWQEGKAFQDGYKVLIENDSYDEPTLTVGETLSPTSIVVKGSGDFILAGNGNLSGSECSINKTGSGTLTITGNNPFTGAVVNHGGTISFNTLKNSSTASPLGASGGQAELWNFDGGTYQYTGSSVSCNRSAKLTSDSTFEISSATVTMSGTFEGSGGLTLDGAGTLSVANKSFFGYTGATTLKGGTLNLTDSSTDTGSAYNFKPSKLVLAGGNLIFASTSGGDESHSFPIYAEGEDTSSITVPQRGSFGCTLHGDVSASIQFNVPYCREFFGSIWSDYSGEIIANGTGSYSIFASSGSFNATKVRFYLTGSAHMSAKTTNATNYVGGISGDKGTYLLSSSESTSNAKCSWTVGSANSDETFAGVINDMCYNLSTTAGSTSITKVGTGDWRLTGQNVYSGTTTINGGRLFVNAAHSGTGAWVINDGGTLRGTNKITGGGSVTVNSGGTINPGDDGSSSSLTIYGATTFSSGSTLKISGSSFWQQGSCKINSGVTLEIDPTAYNLTKAGTSIRVFKGPGTISGTFSTISPTNLDYGLSWDTSDLYTTNGLLKIKQDIVPTCWLPDAGWNYWDQTASWNNGIPENSYNSAVFTNDAECSVYMDWHNYTYTFDSLKLTGKDVHFKPVSGHSFLSPTAISGTGALYLYTVEGNGFNSQYLAAVGLKTQTDADMTVDVPVYIGCLAATNINDAVQLIGQNGHTITFNNSFTVLTNGVVNPGSASSGSIVVKGATTFKSGSILKITGTPFGANGTVAIESGAKLVFDLPSASLKDSYSVKVFEGSGTITGLFDISKVTLPTLGDHLYWDTSTFTKDYTLTIRSTLTTWIGANRASWDDASNWDGGLPAAGKTVVFTNKSAIAVSMGASSDARVCDEIQLNGGNVKFYPTYYWPRLTPQRVTGSGTLYLMTSANLSNTDTAAVGLESQSATNLVVDVPVVVDSGVTTNIDQDVFFQGYNGHTATFRKSVTVESGARIVAYGNVIFEGGLVLNSYKWNSLRASNTISGPLSGDGTLHLEVTGGVTTFSGDNSSFTGWIIQELYNNVPYFTGGASAPVNGTVNINGDIRIIANEMGETFRFGVLNLTHAAWCYCYVSRDMDVTVEVGSKGDSVWGDEYYFASYINSTGATSWAAPDATFVKVGEDSTLLICSDWIYSNLKFGVKAGPLLHHALTQDFEDSLTYKAQMSGGTVASIAFGTSKSTYTMPGIIEQVAREIYNSSVTSHIFRAYNEGKSTSGYCFTLPDKAANTTKGYRLEFDYYLSQLTDNAAKEVLDAYSGMVVQGKNGVLATIFALQGAKNVESSNGCAFKGDSTASDDKITTVRSWSRGTDPVSSDARPYWYHYTIVGMPSGTSKGVYLSIKRVNGDTTDDVTSYQISADYDTVTILNLISAEPNNKYRRYVGLDDVIIYAADDYPSVSGDTEALVTGDATNGYVITPSTNTANVVIDIPSGVTADKVTVNVPSTASTVKANGATVRIVKGDNDITDYLNIPAAVDGVIDVSKAEVKQAVADETLDTDSGAKVDLTSDPPSLTTAATKIGLDYQLQEGHTIPEMKANTTGDKKTGDGNPWTPNVTVKGGEAGFYRVKVSK